MNRLGFGDFHAAHFSPQQVEQWQHQLQQNLYPPWAHSWPPEQHLAQHEQPPQGEEHTCVDINEEHYDDQDQPYTLSKEAIEIFRFSEAFRKEREAEEAGEGDEEGDTFGDDPYVCSAAVQGGIEAPANRLIHANTESEYPEEVIMKERLLDAEYVKACQTKDSPVVLWPVVPFRI